MCPVLWSHQVLSRTGYLLDGVCAPSVECLYPKAAIVGVSHLLLHTVIADCCLGKSSLEKQIFLLSKRFSYLFLSPLGD